MSQHPFHETVLECTRQFHKVFELDIEKPLTPELRQLRAALIEEESKELIEAVKTKNNKEVTDALADMAYVLGGSIVSLSNDIDSLQYESATEMVNKLVLERFGNTVDDDLIQLGKDVIEVAKGILDPQFHADHVVCLCTFGLSMIEAQSAMLRLDIDAAVREAHRSNMTKLWSEDPDVRQKGVASDPTRYADIAFKYRHDGGEGMIGYRTRDGKILKSPDYEDADFAQFALEIW